MRPTVDAHGVPTGVLQHTLRAYLVDAHGQVRSIYSSGFLDPELLLNDVRTVLGAEEASR